MTQYGTAKSCLSPIASRYDSIPLATVRPYSAPRVLPQRHTSLSKRQRWKILLHAFRMLCSLGALMVPGYLLLATGLGLEHNDSMAVRLGVSCVLLVCLGLSYVPREVEAVADEPVALGERCDDDDFRSRHRDGKAKREEREPGGTGRAGSLAERWTNQDRQKPKKKG